MSTPILEVKKVSKSFPGVQALQEVDLQLAAGEVLAVIGENGAGKSTLMKILAGLQSPDSGNVLLDGQPVVLENTRRAMDHGIFLIHQELNLVENQSVGSNIFLGREPQRFGWINQREIDRRSSELLEKVGLDVRPQTLVGTLTIGKQQMVEIAKAVSADARILIMDEPTSSLSTHETDRLFEVVEDLRKRGVAVIYISHRLREVERLADRVTVLRDGKNAGELADDEISHNQMVPLMVGRDVSQFYARNRHRIGQTMLEVDNLSTPAWPLKKVSLEIAAGEIVGIAGLVGAGRTELLKVLFGIDPPETGSILIGGKKVLIDSPAHAIRAGIALVPEDRKKHGLLLETSVSENISLPSLARFSRTGGFLNFQREQDQSNREIDRLGIRTSGGSQLAKLLSGGNQQKVVIAKWLALKPRMLLLDEPTRGVDMGAKQEIYKLMEQLASEGMAILFASSEMEEILGMSDRVIVMHEGEIAGQLTGDKMSEENVMHLATGNILSD